MSYIQTLSGKRIDFLNLNPEQIVIEDIATALSNCCRFAGHLPEFYSVAQHSVLTSLLVSEEFALEALLHDAQEAYVCDIPSPLKHLLPDYCRMENYVESVIRRKFGLPEAVSDPVKYADLIMLATERQELDTDAALAEIRAQGVDEMASEYRKFAQEDGCSCNMQSSYNLTAVRAESYAAYIRRKGAAV